MKIELYLPINNTDKLSLTKNTNEINNLFVNNQTPKLHTRKTNGRDKKIS